MYCNCPSSNYTQYSILTGQKQVFRNISKFVKKKEALSGWMGSVAAQLFSGLYRDVQVRALAGPLKDIQRLVLKPLLHCLGCVPVGR
jgi:hypothetical protein